jgi:hypothetical protein
MQQFTHQQKSTNAHKKNQPLGRHTAGSGLSREPATSRQAALGLSGYQIPGGRRNLITHGRAEQPMKNQLLWHGKSRRNRTGPRAGTRARTLTEDSPAASEPKAEREVQGTGKSMSWPVHCNEPATATARRQDPENESF